MQRNEPMKESKTHTKRFTKRNTLPALAVSALFSFTVLLFSPLRIYSEVPAAFTVDAPHLFIPMIGAALAGTLIFWLLHMLLLRIGEVPCGFFSRILLGFILAGTIQEIFLNSKMPVVLKSDIRYPEFAGRIRTDMVIYLIAAALPPAIYAASLIMRKKTDRRIIPVLSGIIFAGELAVSLYSFAGAHPGRFNGIQRQYLSYAPASSVSSEKNVVVFLTDRLDGDWMDELLEKYPELYDEFSGFTFYRNTVSSGTSTFPVVPELLTETSYKESHDEWYRYIDSAWKENTLLRRLKESGYKVNLFPDCITCLGSPAQVKDQCDNIRECSDSDISFNYFGHRGIIEVMARLSAARLSPFQWKHPIMYWLGANVGRDMIKYVDLLDDLHNKTANPDSDMQYWNYLSSNGLSADSDSPTFSFFHLSGCHTNDERIVGLYDPSADIDVYSTARGDFEILFRYFDELKRLGAYDDTTIIVMGDHGRPARELNLMHMKLQRQLATAVLVKPAGSKGTKLATDSDSPLSIDYISPSILEYAGADRSDLGYSINDIVSGHLSPPRYFQSYFFEGYGRMTEKSRYRINGDVHDFSNWEIVSSDENG